MTEEELLENFEAKVKRYLSELDKSSLDCAGFARVANEYYDAAQNLGANLLLRMVEAYRERGKAAAETAELRADLEQIGDSITAATQANRTSEAEIAKLRDELRATVRQATAMEGAGCDAIAALRAVSVNPGLSDAQHRLVADALMGMFEAKPRWLSRPAANAEKGDVA
jgi:hypothetical protein